MLLNTRLKWHKNLDQGILAVPEGYFREAEEETKVNVKEFFERDDVSCLCPGKKDYVSFELEDGRKEKVYRRLLPHLKEICQHFVTGNAAVRVDSLHLPCCD